MSFERRTNISAKVIWLRILFIEIILMLLIMQI